MEAREHDAELLRTALTQSARFGERELWEQAWEVLEDLPVHLRATTEIIQARVAVLLGAGEPHKALILAQGLAAAFPHRPDALFRLACSYGATGQPDAAREAARRCIDLDRQWRERVLDEPLLEGIW